MFEGFGERDVTTPAGARIRVRVGGSGPPVLLLHGYPQTSVMWHRVAPELAADHTVVVADLRGYGDSVPPPGTADDPATFSKRSMAADQVAVMAKLGFDRFAVAGHDRGGRCAYRLALDHPHSVTALAVLDILPTADVLARVDAAFAASAWHWFFLAQAGGLPQRLVSADPDGFFLRGTDGIFTIEARAAYRAAFRKPSVIHAMCQDYRAGLTVDRADDEADRGRRRIGCPTLVLWGRLGPLGRTPDVLEVWRRWAPAAEGRDLDCGHFLAEERPEATVRELRTLLSRAGAHP